MSTLSDEVRSPHFAPRLGRDFYSTECTQLAKELIGKVYCLTYIITFLFANHFSQKNFT